LPNGVPSGGERLGLKQVCEKGLYLPGEKASLRTERESKTEGKKSPNFLGGGLTEEKEMVI